MVSDVKVRGGGFQESIQSFDVMDDVMECDEYLS